MPLAQRPRQRGQRGQRTEPVAVQRAGVQADLLKAQLRAVRPQMHAHTADRLRLRDADRAALLVLLVAQPVGNGLVRVFGAHVCGKVQIPPGAQLLGQLLLPLRLAAAAAAGEQQRQAKDQKTQFFHGILPLIVCHSLCAGRRRYVREKRPCFAQKAVDAGQGETV